jgi:peptidoglycan-associated lipoprotein
VVAEGHCDERGAAEYNLALGDRRARAAVDYLVSIGIPPNRFSVVSYGAELPADPSHNESAWSKNRRVYLRVAR